MGEQVIINLRDYEAVARERMTAGDFAYVSGGAGDQVTLRRNEEAFARRTLVPRVLVDVRNIDTSTTLLGTPVAMPAGVAPTALHELAHPEAECATARGAAAAGVMFCASTNTTRTMEEIAAASEGPRWFQLYTHVDRDVTERLIRRARDAGYRAIVLTVDVPYAGLREDETRLGWEYPVRTMGNYASMASSEEELARLIDGNHDAALTWDDLGWIREVAGDLPLVIKGVLAADDARLAVEHGAAAVWVSNHGGRQLDRSPASIDALEAIVDAVGGRAEVYLDGGVRRGVDVVTALALGARAVFLGRPVLYALAAGGAEGVTQAFGLLREEIENTMALLGVRTVAEITRAHAT